MIINPIIKSGGLKPEIIVTARAGATLKCGKKIGILTNLLNPSNFSLSNVTVSDGIYTFGSTSGVLSMINQSLPTPIIGHQYYGRCYQKVQPETSIADARFEYFYNDSQGTGCMTFCHFAETTQDNEWHLCSSIKSLTSLDSSTGWILRSFSVNATRPCYRKEMMIIDLTETFGSGNEPTKEWCDLNISYFINSVPILIDDQTYTLSASETTHAFTVNVSDIPYVVFDVTNSAYTEDILVDSVSQYIEVIPYIRTRIFEFNSSEDLNNFTLYDVQKAGGSITVQNSLCHFSSTVTDAFKAMSYYGSNLESVEIKYILNGSTNFMYPYFTFYTASTNYWWEPYNKSTSSWVSYLPYQLNNSSVISQGNLGTNERPATKLWNGSNVSLNTWHLFKITADGSYIKFYSDDTLIHTIASSEKINTIDFLPTYSWWNTQWTADIDYISITY